MISAEGGAERRKLGFWMSTALVTGNMIGSGIFLLPASLAAIGSISIAGWLFTSAGAIVLALTFARLSRMVPGTGGPYAYTRYAFGDLAAFLVAWGYWISIWVGNAAIAVAFTGYLGFFIPGLASNPPAAALTAITSIWILTWVNSSGVRRAGMVQVVTTILKLLPLLGIGTLGLLSFRIENLIPFNVSGASDTAAITAAAALTLWAFLGLESATIPADDVQSPERTIPRATIIGTLVAAIVYILGTIAVMGVIPASRLAGSTAPFAEAAAEMWGSWAAHVVAAGAALACFGALNGWILLQGQLPMAAAHDRLFPGLFARRSRRGTPVFGLVFSSLLVTGLVGLNYLRNLVDLFTFTILLATLTTLIPYLFSTAAALLSGIRERHRDTATPAGKKQGSWAAIITSGLALLYSLWALTGIGREAFLWGCVLLAAGLPVYGWLKKNDRRRYRVR